MTTLRTAAQQALEALEESLYATTDKSQFLAFEAITALRAALAETDFPLGHASTDVPMTVYVLKKAESEPVAWIHTDPDKPRVKFLEWRENEPGYRGSWIKTPLYTAPPHPKPLTEEEIGIICASLGFAQISPVEVARAIERAHGIT